jgi:glycosyltransferase involved in cell wall biosynthesis
MKICYIGSVKSPHIQRWGKWFADKGHEVHLITSNYAEIEGVTVHLIGTGIEGSPFNFLKKTLQTRKLVRKIEPEILHAHYIVGYGVFGAFSGHHPFIMSCWGSDVRTDPEAFIKNRLTKYVLKKADVVHVQDPLMAERVKELCPHKNILIQAWGVNCDIFKSCKSTFIETDYPLVLCTRNTKPLYDIETLVRAIPLVLKKTDVIFVFTKPGFSNLHGVPPENLRITGFLDLNDYVKLVQNCNLYVDTFYPTDERGGQSYGQALLEAMASEIPTLIANRPTLHIHPSWYFGETFKAGDPVDLAKNLINLINNEERQKEIVRNNKEAVVKYFDWNKNMTRIEKEVYRKME